VMRPETVARTVEENGICSMKKKLCHIRIIKKAALSYALCVTWSMEHRERKSHFNIWHCMLGLSCGAAVSAVDDNDDDEDGEQILDFFSTFNLSLLLCVSSTIYYTFRLINNSTYVWRSSNKKFKQTETGISRCVCLHWVPRDNSRSCSRKSSLSTTMNVFID
jgi:hypothetical protein